MRKVDLETDILSESSKLLIQESEKVKNCVNDIYSINNTIKDYYNTDNSETIYTETKLLIEKIIKDYTFMEIYGKTLKDIENGVIEKETEYKKIYEKNLQELEKIR